MLNLSKKTFNLIKNHAIKENPYECCGLLIESGNYIHPYSCRNMADDKVNNFSLSPYDYLNADGAGKIIGFYHSHCLETQPNEFTLLDKLNSINHKLPLVLYYLPKDEFKIFNEKNFLYNYIGRPFEYNVNDCLSLVEEFYSKEFNIIFPTNNRNESWNTENPFRILENIENYGFVEIKNKESLKFGDIILINDKENKHPIHLMIYVDNNQILHQRPAAYSTIEQYNDLYKKQTYNIIRHKNLCYH